MNEHTSLEKYTNHTLFSKWLRKGWCWLCVRGELVTEQTATYWPQVSLTIAALLPHSAGLLNRGPAGPNLLSGTALTTASCSQLQLELKLWLQLKLNTACLELQLTQAVCGTWLYNCLTSTFLWAYVSAPNSRVRVIFWYLQPDAPVSWLTVWLRVNMLQYGYLTLIILFNINHLFAHS